MVVKCKESKDYKIKKIREVKIKKDIGFFFIEI